MKKFNLQNIILFILLFLEFFLLTISNFKNSMTFDEIVYPPAGLSYLEKGDFRLNLEHPPLSKYLMALPLFISGYKNDYETQAWQKGDQIRFGARFYFNNGNLIALNISRFSTIFITLSLSILLYLFVLKNFGKTEALLSLFFFVFYPDNIAQGSLATTD
ncbi:MAG: phospholipid carrier-dependent glycosyltransferase, partial [Thermoanaerobaculia bacterium]